MVYLVLTDPLIDTLALSFVIPLCLATTAIGYAVRERTRLAADLLARTRELEQQRERTAALAIAVERTRLASELDLTARDRLREMVALAEREQGFAQIERLGRDSLNDMRALLGVLRSDGRAPQPTLAQLGALLDAARRRGRAVELAIGGEARPLPGGVEVTAYRIVEHALDGDEPLHVRLDYRPDALELELRGATERAVAAVRERVGAHGGRLTFGPGAVKAQPASATPASRR
jgi:signal transduction histidine kinase